MALSVRLTGGFGLCLGRCWTAPTMTPIDCTGEPFRRCAACVVSAASMSSRDTPMRRSSWIESLLMLRLDSYLWGNFSYLWGNCQFWNLPT